MTAPKPVTLARAADEYLDTLGTESTKRTYGAALKAMRARFGDDTALSDLTPENVDEWLQETWGGDQASAATFNVRLRGVRAAARWWARKGWIPAGLTEDVESRKARAVREVVILTPDELKALMERALGSPSPSAQSPTGIRNKALIMFMYRSGLRISEVLAMRPGAIDHGDQSIRVHNTKAGKTQVRYYHATAEESLARWLDTRRTFGFNGRQPVFCTISAGPRTKPGNEMSRQAVSQMLKESAKQAGIDKRVHPHELRHTYAVELVRSGADVATIQRLLGHESLASTAKYLASLTNSEAGAVLRSLDMPDVGEGGQQAERDVMAELGALKARLTADAGLSRQDADAELRLLRQRLHEVEQASKREAAAAASASKAAREALAQARLAAQRAREEHQPDYKATAALAEWLASQKLTPLAEPAGVPDERCPDCGYLRSREVPGCDHRGSVTLTGPPIEILGLSTRTWNSLKRVGIDNVAELAVHSEQELTDGIRNFGPASLEEIKQKLAGLGLALRNEEAGQ